MTEKELKKLNRYQLLELLILQTERGDQLQARVEALEEELKEKNLKYATLGSFAEAALQVTGVFQAAQESADLYINSAKEYAAELQRDAYKKANDIIAQAQEQAHRIRSQGSLQSWQVLQDLMNRGRDER